MLKSKSDNASTPTKAKEASEEKQTFTGVIEKHLSDFGVTISSFMKSLDLAESQFYRWKKGNTQPKEEIVNKIAVAIVNYGQKLTTTEKEFAPNHKHIGNVLNELLMLSGYPSLGKLENEVWQKIANGRNWTLGYTDVPPWAYRSPSGPRGKVIDYAESISGVLGLSVDWEYIEKWDGLEAAIMSRRIDAVPPFLIAIPQRFFNYRFSQPCGDIYRVAAIAVIDDPNIQSLDQISPELVKLFVVDGEIGEMAIPVLKKEYKKTVFSSIPSASNALANWNPEENLVNPKDPRQGSWIPVFLSAKETCEGIKQEYGLTKKLQLLEVPDAKHIKTYTCFAVHPDESKLVDIINAAIQMFGTMPDHKTENKQENSQELLTKMELLSDGFQELLTKLKLLSNDFQS